MLLVEEATPCNVSRVFTKKCAEKERQVMNEEAAGR